ncbi:hypothetical protein C8R47DRAFT_1230448 [Mycena vitilis]|nr:hypothetical protein C8R47DRAFT_1230448 [Mycena vitilis]
MTTNAQRARAAAAGTGSPRPAVARAPRTAVAAGKGPAIKRSRRKGNGKKPGKESWIHGTKLRFLAQFVDEWRAAHEKGIVFLGRFYTKVANLFILKYGYFMKDTEDLDEDTDDPTDPDEKIPGAEDLSEEEAAERSEIAASLRKRIAAWYCRTYRDVSESEKVFFAEIVGGMDNAGPGHPKRAHLIHFYSRRYYDERVKARFEASYAVEKQLAKDLGKEAPAEVKIRNEITREVFDEENEEFQEELKRGVEAEYVAAVRAWELTRAETQTRTPAEVNAALKSAAFYLEPLAEAIKEKFGLNCTIMLCGPMGDRGGAIEVRSVHAGTTKGLTPRKWHEFDRMGYAEVEKAMVRFSERCFSEEDCLSRTEGVEQAGAALGARPEPDTRGNTRAEPNTSGNARPEPDTHTRPEPNTSGNARPEPDTHTRPEPDTSSNARPEPDTHTRPEPDTSGNARPEPDTHTRPEPDTSGNARPEPDTSGNARPEPDTHTRPEPDTSGNARPEPERPEPDTNSTDDNVDRRSENNGTPPPELVSSHEVWVRKDKPLWSVEISKAMAAFTATTQTWGGNWADCVLAWLEFEAATGYGHGGRLTNEGRPDQVRAWMSVGRRWYAPPVISPVGKKGEVGSYAEEWWCWWDAIQPGVEEGKWGTLPVMHGPTGLILVLATLCWWGVAEEGKEQGEDWEAAVTELKVLLEGLVDSGELVDNYSAGREKVRKRLERLQGTKKAKRQPKRKRGDGGEEEDGRSKKKNAAVEGVKRVTRTQSAKENRPRARPRK